MNSGVDMVDKAILVFDNNCILCSRTASFLSVTDRKNRLMFTAFDSDFWTNHPLNTNRENQSIILLYKNVLYYRSRAILKIIEILGFPWNIILIFRVLPSGWLDSVYDFIARNRYKVLGPRKMCRVNDSVRQRYIK